MKRVIGTAWDAYEQQVIPPHAPDVQRIECRRAFYAGAASLFGAIMNMLEPGQEAIESDLRRIDDLARELREHMLHEQMLAQAQQGGAHVSRSQERFAIEAKCVGETADALLCLVDDLEVWIPKSQVDDESEVTERGDEGELIIPEWLAVERGLA